MGTQAPKVARGGLGNTRDLRDSAQSPSRTERPAAGEAPSAPESSPRSHPSAPGSGPEPGGRGLAGAGPAAVR